MTIDYDFRQARRLTTRAKGRDRNTLEALCRSIQHTEDGLLAAAGPLMARCATLCRGICCRNIHLDAILGRGDLVYILTLRPDLAPEMAARIDTQPRIYTADCVFLENGAGPCIFPGNVKPELCLTTFCEDTAIAAREIGRVRKSFQKLDLFIRFHGLLRLARRFRQRFRPASPER